MAVRLGIDAGGTLIKIAYWKEEGEMCFQHFLSSNFQAVKDWITEHHPTASICLTGGRAEQLKRFLLSDKDIPYIVEFDATMNGVFYQLQQEKIEINSAIIANIGTGTSIHKMSKNNHIRIGGTGVGGGTLLGLAVSTTGISDYQKIISLSKDGKRSSIDVLVSDIYKDNKLPIKGSLTASNFGGVSLKSSEASVHADLLAGIQGLIGEVVATLCIQAAESNGVEDIIFIGSTLEENELLKEIIESYTKLKGKNPIFLEKHGYSGAIGALLENV